MTALRRTLPQVAAGFLLGALPTLTIAFRAGWLG